MKFQAETRVDENGCIRPTFNLGGEYGLTSGFLKYFHKFIGKKVRITIEILEE